MIWDICLKVVTGNSPEGQNEGKKCFHPVILLFVIPKKKIKHTVSHKGRVWQYLSNRFHIVSSSCAKQTATGEEMYFYIYKKYPPLVFPRQHDIMLTKEISILSSGWLQLAVNALLHSISRQETWKLIVTRGISFSGCWYWTYECSFNEQFEFRVDSLALLMTGEDENFDVPRWPAGRKL